MSQLSKLRALNTERMDLDEIVELTTVGRACEGTYKAHQLPVPTWLTDSLVTLDTELHARRRDALMARKKELEATSASLRTREERALQTARELAEVNDALGGVTKP